MIFIKGIASIGAAILIGLSAPSARAGYVVDLTQQGSNVVATGSGRNRPDGSALRRKRYDRRRFVFPVTSKSPLGRRFRRSRRWISTSGWVRPASFGSGDFTEASSGSGDLVGIDCFTQPRRCHRATSPDTPLSDTATYDGATFSSLGVTPGLSNGPGGAGRTRTSRSSSELSGTGTHHLGHDATRLRGTGLDGISKRRAAAHRRQRLTCDRAARRRLA